jgi:hypothetical protein
MGENETKAGVVSGSMIKHRDKIHQEGLLSQDVADPGPAHSILVGPLCKPFSFLIGENSSSVVNDGHEKALKRRGLLRRLSNAASKQQQ